MFFAKQNGWGSLRQPYAYALCQKHQSNEKTFCFLHTVSNEDLNFFGKRPQAESCQGNA